MYAIITYIYEQCGVTALCPWVRHINPNFILVQPRKTRPYITKRLLMGRKESTQTNEQTNAEINQSNQPAELQYLALSLKMLI